MRGASTKNEFQGVVNGIRDELTFGNKEAEIHQIFHPCILPFITRKGISMNFFSKLLFSRYCSNEWRGDACKI